MIAAYRGGVEQAGREPGEVILQTLASWAETDEAALASSREWKGTLVDDHYTEAIADPAGIGRNGQAVSDSTLERMAIVSSDPETHVKKLRRLQRLGASAICVMNVTGSNPGGMICAYRDQVLPALRDR